MLAVRQQDQQHKERVKETVCDDWTPLIDLIWKQELCTKPTHI